MAPLKVLLASSPPTVKVIAPATLLVTRAAARQAVDRLRLAVEVQRGVVNDVPLARTGRDRPGHAQLQRAGTDRRVAAVAVGER